MSAVTSQIWAFVLGLLAKYILSIIVELLPIPDDLRFRVSYESKKIWKWIRKIPIEITYTTKSAKLELREEDLYDKIKDKLISDNFRYTGRYGDSILFQHVLERTEAELTLTPGYSDIEDEGELLISDIQADLVVKCNYKRFEGDMINIIQIKEQLRASLREMLGEWTADSISCELRHMYKFAGILSDFKLSSLSGMIGNQQIDLSEKGLTVYGMVTQELISALKKIITFYY